MADSRCGNDAREGVAAVVGHCDNVDCTCDPCECMPDNVCDCCEDS